MDDNSRPLWKSIQQLWLCLGFQWVQGGIHRKREKRHDKQSDLLLHSRSFNSPHQECKASSAGVCAHTEGDGGLTNAWCLGEGAGPTHFALAIGYFAHCSLAFTTSPHPCPFLLSVFQGEFILSLAHCGEWRDWLAKGWPVVSWLTLLGQPCWS